MVDVGNIVEMYEPAVQNIHGTDDHKADNEEHDIPEQLLFQQEPWNQEEVVEVKIDRHQEEHRPAEDHEAVPCFGSFHEDHRDEYECCPDQEMDQDGKEPCPGNDGFVHFFEFRCKIIQNLCGPNIY